MQPKPMNKDEIQSVLQSAIDEARDFVHSEISEDRVKAQRYFDGKVDIGHEEGRSRVVATKCRDVVRAIKPNLMKTFMQTDKPVEFIPKTQDDVDGAEQATAWAQWKFSEKNGFRLFANALHDALIKKTGILKVYYEEYSDVEIDEYTDLTDEQFAFITNDPEVEILEHEEKPEVTEYGPVTLHDAKVSREKPGGDICISSIPPEDFFVDRNATTLDDCYICGHSTEMRVGDLVKMGFDFEEVVNLDNGDGDDGDEEEFARRGYSEDDSDEHAGDRSMKKVRVHEAYMKMDIEGTGVPKLYCFITGGTKHKILSREICDDLPFAIFEVDPEPHAFFGRSLVELVIEDQNAATVLIRGLLDNVALINTPRTVVLDQQVNMDDVLNNEIGGVIRTKTMEGIREIQVPPIGMGVLPALQYYDEQIETKTGVTRAAMGLNPDALQSTTAAGVNATVQAASGQAEVIARHIAEGGMRQLFRLLLRISRKHARPEEYMRINGRFVPVDPRSWNAEMDISINVGLGTGQQEERLMALMAAKQDQDMIWGNFGPGNGLVTLTQMRNTRAELLKLQGIRNVDRFYEPMDEQREQLLIEQSQQAQGEQSDPNASLAMAEVQKAQITAQAKLQSDTMRERAKMALESAKLNMDAQKMNQDDDRERDQMIQDLIIEAARIYADSGVKVDTARIQAEQAKPRE